MLVDILKLNSKFRIDTQEPPSSIKEIEDLTTTFPSLLIPEDYLSFIKQLTEAEILVLNQTYIRIWGAKDCIEMNQAYHFQKHIPNSLAIGDDEGGSAIMYYKTDSRIALYKIGFGNLNIDDAELISESLHSLLIEGIGAEIFI